MNDRLFTVVVCLILLCLLLTGCTRGVYSLKQGNVQFADTAASGSYMRFNGYQEKSIKLSEGDLIQISATVATIAGTCTISLRNNEKQTLILITGSGSGQLKITESGIYWLRVTGDDHNGSFALSWIIQ